MTRRTIAFGRLGWPNETRWAWVALLALLPGVGCTFFDSPDSKPDVVEADGTVPDAGSDGCLPQCQGKECGDDGCGGLCGSCAADASCSAAGQCVAGCASAANGTPCGGAGYICLGQKCVLSRCGDGFVDTTRHEQCEDKNQLDGDGCDKDCSFTEILQLVAGEGHTCALIESGRIRCWGYNHVGQLGYGHTNDVGDDETPASAGDVAFAQPPVALSSGGYASCALDAAGKVRCWGNGGLLGYGNTDHLGDDELLLKLPAVSVGGEVDGLAMGGAHTCARLVTGKLRCWGSGGYGRLGYGNTDHVGDDETPSSVGDVNVGAAVGSVAAGLWHTCVITVAGGVRCWGFNFYGQLGVGNKLDGLYPSADISALPQGLPATARPKALALANYSTCVLWDQGSVMCWGANGTGTLGQGDKVMIGDDEQPSTLPPVDLPAPAMAITAGGGQVCALLDTKKAYCWGENGYGQLGLGHTKTIGDDEKPGSAGPVALPAPVKQIVAGRLHTCALLETNQVFCWGRNNHGQLGYGHTKDIGDDEKPTSAGPVPIL